MTAAKGGGGEETVMGGLTTSEMFKGSLRKSSLPLRGMSTGAGSGNKGEKVRREDPGKC